MNEKERLLDLAVDTCSENPIFIAYYLKEYRERKKFHTTYIMQLLGVNREDYNRLALCRVPNMHGSDKIIKFQVICEYANCPNIGTLDSIIQYIFM